MLEVLDHGAIRELRLARPPVNALDPTLIARLSQELQAAVDSQRSAVVLSGQPGLFSAGIDVRAIAALDRDTLRPFVHEFFALQQQLAHSSVPIICAITGHCPAGGTVLALYADRRIMARGAFDIGLNEVQIGLYPGEIIHRAFARLVGPRVASDLLPRGALIRPDEALRVGLVDELAEPKHVVGRALEYARELAELPQAVYRRTRALVRADLIRLFDAPSEDFAAVFTEQWFSAEARTRLAGLLKGAK